MKREDQSFQSLLLSEEEKYEDKPEIAVKYARWLLAEKRYKDAALITYNALFEGPRFDLYEMRAYSALVDLTELWKIIHQEQSIQPPKSSTEIYNHGIHSPNPIWSEVLTQIQGF